MEKNMFESYLTGYVNIHKELIKLEKLEKDETIGKKEQEENKKRKQQLKDAKKAIKQNAKQLKEESILKTDTDNKNSTILQIYKDYLKKEQELKKKLENLTQITEIEEMKLNQEIEEISKNKKVIVQQLKQTSDVVNKIEKEYTLFYGQLSIIDKEDKEDKEDKIDYNEELAEETDKDELLKEMIAGREKREKERYNETIKEAMKQEKIQKELEEKDLQANIKEGIENGIKVNISKIGKGQNNPQRLPIRSFWEIYNSTNTEHVGSIAHMLNKWSHMKLLPNKSEDTLQKGLNIPLVPIKTVMKVLSKIPNKLLGTDKKIQKMQRNIDDLKGEEFRVLVEKAEDANRLYKDLGLILKDDFDRDYLEPQFMKQYKVNNAYLDVVRRRLGMENGRTIERCQNIAQENYTKMQELMKKDSKNWTKEQEEQYSESVKTYQSAITTARELQLQLDNFDEGAKKKSSSYRNISGWFAAKFNPDNREQNAQMAKLAKQRREAHKVGDLKTQNIITGQMQEKAREQTKLIGGEKNKIDVGMYSMESPVETLDKGQQNKGRLLLSNVAIAASIVGAYNQIKENIANRDLVQASNEQLKTVTVRGETKISDAPTAAKAEEAITRQSVNAGFDKAERANLDGTDWSFNDAYHNEDISVHTEAAKMAGEAEKLLNQKNNIGALEKAANYYNRVNQNAQARSIEYMENHPEFDYSAFTFGSKADMDTVVEFFKNGKIPYQTNVDLAAQAAIPALKQGVDSTALIMSMGNALYQSQKQGVNDMKKSIKVDVPHQKKNVEDRISEQDTIEMEI